MEYINLGQISTITNGKRNAQDAIENGLYPLFDRSVIVKRSDKYMFDKEAIIVAGEGKTFLPKYYKGKFDLHQRCYAIFDFANGIHPKYIYYYIQWNQAYFQSVYDYFDEIVKIKQYSQETIKGYRRVLRTIFNEAVRFEWITKNPVCGTKVSAGNSNTSLRPVTEKAVFSIAETKEFLKAVDSLGEEHINNKIMIKLMLLTGIRNAELHGLRWSDIDFEKKLIHIKRNRLYSKRLGTYEKCPKTKTSERDIPLSDGLIADLKVYMDWFRLADDDFDNKLDNYYLAVNIMREPESVHHIGSWLKKFEERNGFKAVTCHGLRHTYCSMLLSQNVPIQTVSKYMGHSDSSITLQVYSHFIPDTQEKVVNAINLIESEE